jgi:hypothetical protein
MATFIVVGIVLVPIILLVADLLVGQDRLTAPVQSTDARRQ